jgi:hypothetical protein
MTASGPSRHSPRQQIRPLFRVQEARCRRLRSENLVCYPEPGANPQHGFCTPRPAGRGCDFAVIEGIGRLVRRHGGRGREFRAQCLRSARSSAAARLALARLALPRTNGSPLLLVPRFLAAARPSFVRLAIVCLSSCDGRVDVQHERRGARHVTANEVDLALHQTGDEMDVAR